MICLTVCMGFVVQPMQDSSQHDLAGFPHKLENYFPWHFHDPIDIFHDNFQQLNHLVSLSNQIVGHILNIHAFIVTFQDFCNFETFSCDIFYDFSNFQVWKPPCLFSSVYNELHMSTHELCEMVCITACITLHTNDMMVTTSKCNHGCLGFFFSFLLMSEFTKYNYKSRHAQT